MTTPKQRRNRFWALCCGALILLAAAGASTSEPGSMRNTSVYLGLASACLYLFAVTLGLRKRFLRLPLGSMSAWTSAHLWLGGLALVLALLHTGSRPMSPLGAALLGCVVVVVASGVLGVLIQSIVPRLMTARLPDESPLDDLEPLFVERARSVESLIAGACRERSESEHGRVALEQFHQRTIAPFFRRPLSRQPVLAHEAEATLAFDALRASVDAGLHASVDELRQICDEVRVRAEEGRLRRSLSSWLWLHIPAAVIGLVLLLAHALAALYY